MADRGQITRLPTDPHEDRWNRLAISSKKNDLKAVDVDERLDDYIGFSRHNLTAGFNLQNPGFKDLAKQDDKLKTFNQKILREFEDLKRMKYYPNQNYRFPVSNEPIASSFIINPEQITPALKASEDRIKALESEMDHRERDMVKMSGIIDLLIEENKYLRDHISSKNRDISKILETVGLNDGETTHDLRHRLSLLSEENNILLAHLEELRAVKDNFERFTREKNHELARAAEDYDQCRRSLEEALKREELLTNYKQIMDPKFRQSQDKVAELEATVRDLIDELSHVKNHNVQLSNQVGVFKKTVEEQDGKNTLELDRLVQEVHLLQNEKKEHKKIVEAKDKLLEDRQNELKKVRRDYEQTKLEFEEVVQVLNELKNQLANERQVTEAAVKREKELKDRNNHLAHDLEHLQDKFRKNEEEHHHLIESLKTDHHNKYTKLEHKIQKLKNKMDDKEKKYKGEIAALKAQSEDLARILEAVSAEREDYHRRWEELFHQAEAFAEKERFLHDMEDQIRNLRKELSDKKDELADTERRYIAQNDDLRSENDKLNEIIRDLREELAKYREFLEKHKIEDDALRKELNSERKRRREVSADVQREREKASEAIRKTRELSAEIKRSKDDRPVREKDTYSHDWRSHHGHSARDSTVETIRKREELGVKDTNIVKQDVRKSDVKDTRRSVEIVTPEKTDKTEKIERTETRRVETKDVSELEKENQYLHQMIMNLVQSQETPQQKYYAQPPPRVEPAERTYHFTPSTLRDPPAVNISPIRGTESNTKVYVGRLVEGDDMVVQRFREPIIHQEPVVVHTIREERPLPPPIHHVENVVVREEIRPQPVVVHTVREERPLPPPIVHTVREERPIVHTIREERPIMHMVREERPMPTVVHTVREDFRSMPPPLLPEERERIMVRTPVQERVIVSSTPGVVQQMRPSVATSHYATAPRESINVYTDSKRRDNPNVEHVISGILRKYNMEEIPDYVGRNKGGLGRSVELIRREGFDSTKDPVHMGGNIRSPQMQFLSPLLSSPKYDSKAESLMNSLSKGGDIRERMLSPHQQI